MDQVISLFPPEYLEKLKKRIRIRSTALWILGAAALAVCVTFCCIAGTATYRPLMFWTVGVSTVTGWIIIYQYVFCVRQAKRELAHAVNLGDPEEWEPVEGVMELTKQFFRIRGTVNMRRVKVKTEEEERTLNVCASRSRLLERVGSEVTLYVSHGYIAGYEVRHEVH